MQVSINIFLAILIANRNQPLGRLGSFLGLKTKSFQPILYKYLYKQLLELSAKEFGYRYAASGKAPVGLTVKKYCSFRYVRKFLKVLTRQKKRHRKSDVFSF